VIERAHRDAAQAATAANRFVGEAMRRRHAGDLVGELGARAVAAYYRHLTREHLARGQRARFERVCDWLAGQEWDA
jgi:hypothetical protein